MYSSSLAISSESSKSVRIDRAPGLVALLHRYGFPVIGLSKARLSRPS
jgi:hypothetical protein